MSKSDTRTARPGRRGRLGALVAAALVLVSGAVLIDAATGVSADGEPHAWPDQSQSMLLFPNLQTQGSWIGDVFIDSPTGMDGMGESVIEVQSRSGVETTYDLELHSNVVSRVTTSGVLPPLGGQRWSLEQIAGTEFSNYSGRFVSSGPVGGVVRTTWYGGASTVHEGLTPARDLILPIVNREVYSNSSIIYIKNLSAPGEDNKIDFLLFEEDGSIRKSWTVTMTGDEALPDDLYRERVFYRDLPQNAAGGFIGSFHVSSEDPVAIALFGDEPIGVGSYALTARPLSAASDRQFLPLVRSNFLGDSLLVLTNAERSPVQVTITYLGHPASPSGAAQTFEQTISIPPRYYATVDLSSLGRGSVAPPELPKGDGWNTGFLGSAVVRATGNVVAAVWEDYRESNYVLGSAAYNAFGPSDLDSSYVVPRAFMAPDGQPSFLIAQNPGNEPAVINTTLYQDDGSIYAIFNPVTVPAGEMRFIALATPDYGNVRVVATSDQPVAMLVLDARPQRDRTIYAAVRMPGGLVFPTITPTTPPTAGPSPTPTGSGSPTATRPRPTGDYWGYLPAAYRH